MDLDILLTYRIKDFGFVADIPIDEEFILENYPIYSVPTDVHVVSTWIICRMRGIPGGCCISSWKSIMMDISSCGIRYL